MRNMQFKFVRSSTLSTRNCGFTMIEIAMALVVVALVLGAILVPLTTQVEQRKINDTQKALEETKEALIGFAITRGHLPCPDKISGIAPFLPNDTPNDGIEDFDLAGNCTAANAEGNLPWATLGVANADPWGNRFRFRVAQIYAQHVTPFTLASVSTLEVCTTVVPVPPGACSGRLTTGGDGPPAIIMSHGKNGYLAINVIAGAANPCPPTGCSADELANADGNIRFVSRTQSDAGSTAGEFDDIVTWMSGPILFNRMVSAGKLP